MPGERIGPGPEEKPTHDEEDQLERAFTHDFYEVPEPAEDSHLEDFYNWQQSGDEDF